MSSVKENLAAVRERIVKAAEAAGRDPASVTLVAVSKTKPIEAIREAWDAGQRDFGENYAQELVQKSDVLPDARWHFIGHLQSNKAKLIASRVHMVHSVDSPSLAKELGKRAVKRLPVLVEVNVSGEATKAGCQPSELEALLAAIEAQPNLALSGLMTMPPPGDLAVAKATFDSLRSLRDAHGGIARLPQLSMGMTDDLDVAIACGATLVRVGTAIFGSR
jgi:PLP dependent protein